MKPVAAIKDAAKSTKRHWVVFLVGGILFALLAAPFLIYAINRALQAAKVNKALSPINAQDPKVGDVLVGGG